jgi:hypothetical protein
LTSSEPKFRDLQRLCLFGHLEGAYHDKIWVVCDGDPSGVEAIRKLTETYPTWEPDRFVSLERVALENYYPHRFAGDVDSVLSMKGQSLRQAKKDLLNLVLTWIENNENLAKSEFESSAGEFRNLLLDIQSKVLPSRKS